MPTNIGTRPTRKIHSRALEVLGLSPSTRRNTVINALQSLRVIQNSFVHVGVDVARGNAVDSDALGRPLVGEALCHLADGALGGSVGGDSQAALESKQRAEVDDAAAAAGDGGGLEGKHVAADVAAEGEDGVEVYLHDLLLFSR